MVAKVSHIPWITAVLGLVLMRSSVQAQEKKEWIINGLRDLPVQPIAFWPLNKDYEGRDVSGNGHDAIVMENVVPDQGPLGQDGGSYFFQGSLNSYIEFPNNGKLDTKYSITIVAAVYPLAAAAGPILSYISPGRLGVMLWPYTDETGTNLMFLPQKDTDYSSPNHSQPALELNAWNLVAASYEYGTGAVTMWVNGKQVYSGIFTYPGNLATYGRRLRAGHNGNAASTFQGRLACLQVYDQALWRQAILSAMDACPYHDPPVAMVRKFGNKCYGLSAPAAIKNHSEASATCKEMGGSLVKVSDDNEHNILKTFIKERNDVTHWIGVSVSTGPWSPAYEDGTKVNGQWQPWAAKKDEGLCVSMDKEMGCDWAPYPCYCKQAFVCASDYYEAESPDDKCSNCVNGATCKGCFNSLITTCDCQAGFTGERCEININECASNPCQNNGLCVDGANSYGCQCTRGFSGANCEIEIDECESSPCQNGGSCIDHIGWYSCRCAPGFLGSDCEININECDSRPCANGGECIDGLNSFTCNCTLAFSGLQCESAVDLCTEFDIVCPTPFYCVNQAGAFVCKLPGNGVFSGRRKRNILPRVQCSSASCPKGWYCMVADDGYTCIPPK
ncbi:uncharacterized protein LOC118412408 [Branchiostoma floridae]|uniref:Uncharacterized protein LOC118412408 n=1 Tax=Branchiostoma floridae TaxID=7739 RepID=C3ZJX0_BRAFL|nr:uncharacterized protein LOC118412408 [Branchiostoma floridae]|eukprot:XP_002591126.1 hypothetical protein BRAFLDRAFT_105530 [Branchiostoma floridae]